MDLLRIGDKLGRLEGIVSKIDCGTLNTKKNNQNADIRREALVLINGIRSELTNQKNI